VWEQNRVEIRMIAGRIRMTEVKVVTVTCQAKVKVGGKK
jgi:hypothetical protein